MMPPGLSRILEKRFVHMSGRVPLAVQGSGAPAGVP